MMTTEGVVGLPSFPPDNSATRIDSNTPPIVSEDMEMGDYQDKILY
jgi:hypothetical protein